MTHSIRIMQKFKILKNFIKETGQIVHTANENFKCKYSTGYK